MAISLAKSLDGTRRRGISYAQERAGSAGPAQFDKLKIFTILFLLRALFVAQDLTQEERR